MSEEIADKIVRRIRAEGPLTVAAYMAMALHDPEGGYYAKRGPIGAAGDFTTAPEISQVFGELIGLWCAELWQRIGRPDPVILAELGPGRGVLMNDLLHAAGTVPEFRRALRICLVEASPVLHAEQERRLRHAQPAWVTRVEELPDGPLLVVANEFLDALPIRQFVRGSGGWSERLVAVDPEGHLVFVDGPQSPAASLLVPGGLSHCAPGTIVEICPTALALAGALGCSIGPAAGCCIVHRLWLCLNCARNLPYVRFNVIARFARWQRRVPPISAPTSISLPLPKPLGPPAPKFMGRSARADFSPRSAPACGSRRCARGRQQRSGSHSKAG